LREISDPEIFRKSFLVGHQADSKTVSGLMTEETLKIEEEMKCDIIFQQDNDPKHTSKVAQNYLTNKKIVV
jgi:hypothetical protein